jgi:thiamine-phosphate pyrophosphorylase
LISTRHIGLPCIDFCLYLITDRCQTQGRPLVDVVRAALDGGIKVVQLREKDLVSREVYRLALELRELTCEYGSKLFINDRIDIAMAVGADGVHLGVGSIPVVEARKLAGPNLLIGYSSHSTAEARRAEAEGADFVTFGPVYQTASKLSYGAPLGVTALKDVCQTLSIPVFALGGVNPANVAEVLSCGAAGIALISAIIGAADPKNETASLLKMIEEHATNT